jgi:thiol-disulfide isomerase/thioredoxin
LTEFRLAAELGVFEDIGVALVVPLRLVDTGIRYIDSGGAEVDLVRDGIHHRNETMFGVVDPWLLGHHHGQRGRWSYDLRAGLSVPLGRTEEDPFRLGDMGLAHQHFQFGTGTFNPIAGLEVAYTLPAVGVRAFALTQQILYENGKDYQAGDRYAGGVGAVSALGTRKWRFQAGGEVQGETAERWGGVVHTDDGNQGRVDFMLAARAGLALGAGLEASLGAKLPVYTHVVGGQLDYPLVVDVGIGGSFELFGEDHDHAGEHDHGGEGEHDNHESHEDRAPPPAPGAPGAPREDIAEVTTTGEAVDLAPVGGKITVFDFWAPWCVPCKALDEKLRQLARRHPDRLAIRRLNVVDWDSPASERYLTRGGFGSLPHIKVFRADRSLAFEKSGAPADLLRQLEPLLAE